MVLLNTSRRGQQTILGTKTQILPRGVGVIPVMRTYFPLVRPPRRSRIPRDTLALEFPYSSSCVCTRKYRTVFTILSVNFLLLGLRMFHWIVRQTADETKFCILWNLYLRTLPKKDIIEVTSIQRTHSKALQVDFPIVLIHFHL